MDKFEQITKLVEAYNLISAVIDSRGQDAIADELQSIADSIADTSDEIEMG